jgi:SpoVK/Ycf46/Vps4 family AAA+-type ATPase
MGAPVFVVRPADILSKWLGDAEKQLAELFREARRLPLALIFVDEIDALAPARRDGEGNGAMERVLTQLLTELDGFEPGGDGVRFLGASNRPWEIDPALLRPGRFDALCYVGLPDHSARESILRERLNGVPIHAELNFADAARLTEGCAGAEVAAVATMAAQAAFLDSVESGRLRPVENADLARAAATVHRAATPELLARYRDFRGAAR